MLTQKVPCLPSWKLEDNWKITKVERNSMQLICSRICSFPTSIPRYFINRYSKAGDRVFDMWSGKGTVPFEALRSNRIGIGNDKSPEAFVLTHAKVKPISFPELQRMVLGLKHKMSKVSFPRELGELDRKASVFYSRSTFEQVLRLRLALIDENSPAAIFTKAVILGLLHGTGQHAFSLRCSHSYSMSPAYVKKYAKIHHLRRPSRNVLECILKKAGLLYADPLPNTAGEAYGDDSTDVSLPSNNVDMILTSPPYFDRQTYAWANWLRLWFLGYDYRETRKGLAESGSKSKYREFMRRSIAELFRVLKPGGRCFIVVGDVRDRDGRDIVNTADFLIPLCYESGFEVEMVVTDEIPAGRRVMTHIPKDRGIKKERIIYLKKAS